MYESYACPNLVLVNIIIVIIIIIISNFNNIRNAFIGRIFLNVILLVEGGERIVYFANICRCEGRVIYTQVFIILLNSINLLY